MHIDTTGAVSVDTLRRLVRVDIVTGKLYWLARPEDLMEYGGSGGKAGAAARWNGNFAGKEGFITDHKGYRRSRILGRSYYAHHVVWALVHGEWPTLSIDHENRDRSDNRPSNLRHVAQADNCKNQPLRTNNSSGVNGVTWNRRQHQWIARIGGDETRSYLGAYESFDEAVVARKSAERRLGYHKNHGAPVGAV